MMRINFDTLRRVWTHSFPRKVALASGVVVVGAAGLAAMESYSGLLGTPDPAACCTGAVATGESMLSPAIGADKDFFEVPSSPPSVMFLLGNNRSMQDFSTYLPEPKVPALPIAGTKRGDPGYADPDHGNFTDTGCSDAELTGAMSWFDKDSTDPEKNGGTPYDGDSDLGEKYFDPAQFYFSRGWRVAWGGNGEDVPYSMGPSFTNDIIPRNAADSCRLINNNYAYYNTNPKSYNECLSCLASKGWWRGPIVPETVVGKNNNSLGPKQYEDEPKFPREAYRKWVLSGRVLNVRPPKFVVARKVLKDIIDTATNVRMGVANFGEDRGWYDPPWILRDIAPACSKSYPEMNEAALDRPAIKKAINKSKFRHNERSVGEALFGLGGYFSSQGVDSRWSQWFEQVNIGNDTLGDGSNGGKGMNYWPGNPYGGTINNPRPPYQNTGNAYARSSDEWLKLQYTDTTTGVVLPGQRFEQGGDNKAVCFACQVSSVIVITDGTPKYDNSVPITKMMKLLVASGARHETPGKELVTFDPSDPKNNKNSGGINYCDQFGATKKDCDYDSSSSETVWNWPHGMAEGNKNFMDDVAFFLAHSDLRTADNQEAQSKGVQSVRTYTIGYGDNSPMLQSIAKAGKGKFYRADSGPQLREALLNALGDIKQMSTSFASSNISGVQTSGMQSSTFVPRFVPRRGRPYEGHLFRFFYFNEFAQGCEAMPAGSTAKHKFDLNEDGDCDDAFYLDKPTGFTGGVPDISKFTKADIVQENDEGNWVQVATAVFDATTNTLKGGLPAEPFWDLAETLNLRKAAKECDLDNPLNPNGGRCIFTLIDRNKDGKFTAEDNPPVEFHEKNVADLKGYILASGDGFCSTLFSKSGADVPWTGSAADQDLCVKRLVRFVRGVDVFDYDGDNNRTEGRPCADELTDTPVAPTDPNDPEEIQHGKGQKTCKLADIFHSTPVTVEPPVDPFLCSLGLSPQCASTLYDDFAYSVTSEPLCGSGSAKPCYKATPLATPRSNTKRNGTYDDYLTDPILSKRDRIALVGSNGGMLHAIHVGTANQTGSGTLGNVYDVGTGQELWAFVPPDLMPKLNLMISGHDYYVDGTAMVRDIWADGSGASSTRDGIKQKDEFRTIAVMGERSGGQRFSALDVSDPYMMLKAVKNPGAGLQPFRWMFPNACDKESMTMGQSWSNFAPKPPPIGPVRLKAGLASGASDQDRGWEERWVTVLNGGYSPDLTRGRGVYMVDAWSGQKLWSVEAQPGATSGGYADVINKMQPVVAAPSLVDIGKGDSLQRDTDGFFDTMLVGDMGGQVWTFRLKEPGEMDPLTNQVKNWFGARSLEVQRSDTTVNGHEKSPFFHVVSAVLQPDTGWLRAFVGTGDRQHLRTSPGSDCSADDLLACIRLKCNVKATFSAEVNGKQRDSTVEYVGGVLTSSADSWQNTLGSACSASRMELSALTYSCPGPAYGSVVYDAVSVSAQTSCSMTSGRWECTRAPLNTYDHHDQKLDANELTTVGTNRYFGFHAYGGKRMFTDEAGAIAFDRLRVTDKQGVTCDGLNCSLVDVTIPDSLYKTTPAVNGVSQRFIPAADLNKLKRAGPEDAGWFIRYSNDKAERTASGSTVLAGVVFWSSFAPSTTAGADVCSLSGMNDKSYSWQADAITGLPDQASGFKLTGSNAGFIASRASKTSAPPGEPTPVIAMSTTGGIRYQVAISSAGAAPTTETLSTRKNTTPDISWMEVPRNVHECRHENSGACAEE